MLFKHGKHFQKRQMYICLQTLVMLFCMAALFISMLTYSMRVQSDVYEDYQNISRSSLNSLMHSIDIILRDVQDVSMQLFQDSNVHRFLYEETVRKYDIIHSIVNKTEQVMLSNRYIDSVYIAAIDRGVVYASNYGLNSFEDTPDNAFVEWYYNSRSQIEIMGTRRVVVQKYTGLTKDIISVYARLPMGTLNNARGVLVINLDANEIYQSIAQPILEDNESKVYILNEDGQIIIAQNPAELYTSIGDLNLPAAQMQDMEGALFTEIDGENYLLVYNSENTRKWRYIYMYPTSVVRRTLHRQNLFMLLVCSGVLAAVYLVSSRIARLTVNPADELINLVRERTSGGGHTLSSLHEELSQYFHSSDRMRLQLEEAVDALRERLLLNLLNNPFFDEQKVRQGFQQYDIPLTGYNMQLALLGFDFESFQGPIASDLIGLTAIPVIKAQFQQSDVECICVVSNLGEVTLIMEASAGHAEAISPMIERAICEIYQSTGVHSHASLYDIPFELPGICHVYRQAHLLEDYRRLYGNEEIICFSDIHDFSHRGYNYAYEREDTLCNCIRAGSLEDSLNALRQLIETFGRHSHLNQENILLFNVNLYTGIMRLAYEQNLPVEFISHYSDQASTVQRFKSLEQTAAFFEQIISEIIAITTQSRQDRQDRRFEDIKDYIHKNFAKVDLSLEMAADHLNISSTYVNQILKNREGTTFTQMLVKTRIHRACELLEETDMKVQEIAEAVGYSSANYFVRSFKSAVGVTPGKYKEGIRHES